MKVLKNRLFLLGMFITFSFQSLYAETAALLSSAKQGFAFTMGAAVVGALGGLIYGGVCRALQSSSVKEDSTDELIEDAKYGAVFVGGGMLTLVSIYAIHTIFGNDEARDNIRISAALERELAEAARNIIG